MNVQETIEKSLLFYPSLYKNRVHVLHHLFCVGGNGYDWHIGQLVDVCDSYPKGNTIEEQLVEWHKEKTARQKYDREQYKEINNLMKKIGSGTLEDMWRERDAEEEAIQKRYKELANFVELDREEYIYAMGKHCNLLTIPESARLDWVEAAKEMAGYVLLYESSKTKKNYDGITNFEVANMALERLSNWEPMIWVDWNASGWMTDDNNAIYIFDEEALKEWGFGPGDTVHTYQDMHQAGCFAPYTFDPVSWMRVEEWDDKGDKKLRLVPIKLKEENKAL